MSVATIRATRSPRDPIRRRLAAMTPAELAELDDPAYAERVAALDRAVYNLRP